MELLFAFLISFFALAAFFAACEREFDYVAYSLVISSFFMIWVVLSISLTDWSTETQEYECHTISGVDVIVLENSSIVNLNKELGKDIEEGTIVVQTRYKAGWYGGIYWLPSKMPTYTEKQGDR